MNEIHAPITLKEEKKYNITWKTRQERDRQTNRQTDRQTDNHIIIHTDVKKNLFWKLFNQHQPISKHGPQNVSDNYPWMNQSKSVTMGRRHQTVTSWECCWHPPAVTWGLQNPLYRSDRPPCTLLINAHQILAVRFEYGDLNRSSSCSDVLSCVIIVT